MLSLLDQYANDEHKIWGSGKASGAIYHVSVFEFALDCGTHCEF